MWVNLRRFNGKPQHVLRATGAHLYGYSIRTGYKWVNLACLTALLYGEKVLYEKKFCNSVVVHWYLVEKSGGKTRTFQFVSLWKVRVITPMTVVLVYLVRWVPLKIPRYACHNFDCMKPGSRRIIVAKAVLFVYFNSIVVSCPQKSAGKEIFPPGYIDGNKWDF